MENKEIIKTVIIAFVFICGFIYYFNKYNSNDNVIKINNSHNKYHLYRFLIITVISLLPAIVYFIIPYSIGGATKAYLVLLLSICTLIGLLIYFWKRKR